ncbi:MAG: Nramp family divalent metal transporter [Bacteroidetes bacterium]|nr:Nramp family divalent metal transporter [Bacteroidota bacterium]
MNKSLEEVNASVNTNEKKGWRRFLAFLGPAYMISVGYMDPGNWATDIAGGSKFGYSLLWVLLMSNVIALLLQSHCVRLGIVTGKDLAQASRDSYPKSINLFLYLLAEIAIAACDLAEVIGMAIGINLLFPQINLIWAVLITVFDSFILLFLLNKGIRKLEAFIISLIALIGISFFIQLLIAKPNVIEVVKGFAPSIQNNEALYIAIGIIGATVMPHNLYLHSSLVQTRKFNRNKQEIKRAIKFNIIDSSIALNLALFVNMAILIVAASTFFKSGNYEVAAIQQAHQLLQPILGSSLAPLLFAFALIAAGQSSTITGTLAGQVVMEGYLNLRLQPWVRRIITRLIAIIPALLVVLYTGENGIERLLILSQVILSLQLGFAIIPLIHFVSDKSKMGEFTIPAWQKILSWVAAGVIIALNMNLVYAQLKEMLFFYNPLIIGFTLIPLCLFCFIILLYITIAPFVSKQHKYKERSIHQKNQTIVFDDKKVIERIAVCVDFSNSDLKAINRAHTIAGKSATYLIIHVLESANAFVLGEHANDLEREEDVVRLNNYKQQLQNLGLSVEIVLGFGNPKQAIPKLVQEYNCEMLVMGTHGHKTLKDILLGTTIEGVRHELNVPLMLV